MIHGVHHTDNETNNDSYTMATLILWILSLILFTCSHTGKFILLQIHDPSGWETFRSISSWILGTTSTIIVLFINYPKLKERINKILTKKNK